MSQPSRSRTSTSELKGRKLGRVLTKMGKVTREQVHEALGLQQSQPSRKIGDLELQGLRRLLQVLVRKVAAALLRAVAASISRLPGRSAILHRRGTRTALHTAAIDARCFFNRSRAATGRR